MKLSQRLDAVARARQAFVLARATLEQRLRDQMAEELTNLQTQVDIAVRYAFDSGESKAAIMRAMGTKDYNTMQSSLERTQGVAEVVGADPLGDVYWKLTGENGASLLVVNYVNHGDDKLNGKSDFEVRVLDDGRTMLSAYAPLWDETFTVRNDAVAVLDGKFDGKYYEEAVAWLSEQ